MTTDTIKFKRGVKSKLNNLSYGEPAYISDEGELYIGTKSGVEKLTSNKEVKELSSQLEQNTSNIGIFEKDKVNVVKFGVVGDGVTDDTENLKKAINYALLKDFTLYIPKYLKCKITNNLSFFGLSSVIIDGIIIGEDCIVEIGYNSQTTYPSAYFINNIQATLKICGLKTGSVVVNYANKVLLFADSNEAKKSSIAYSRFEFGRIDELEINSNNDGWINENTFMRCRCSKFTMDGNYQHNNNTFYKMTFESIDFKLLNGAWNYFYDCRFEGVNSVVFGEEAVENIIYRSWYSAFPAFVRDTVLPTYTDNGINNMIIAEHDKCYDRHCIYTLNYHSNNFDTSICYKKDNGTIGLLKSGEEIMSTGLLEILDNFRVEIQTDATAGFRYAILIYNENKELIQSEIDPGVVNTPGIFGWRGNGKYLSGNYTDVSLAVLKNKGAKYIEIIINSKDSEATDVELNYINVFLYQRKGRLNQVSTCCKSKYKNLTGKSYPTTGSWTVGDIVYNSSPTQGSCVGWICISSPCEWKEFGMIN